MLLAQAAGRGDPPGAAVDALPRAAGLDRRAAARRRGRRSTGSTGRWHCRASGRRQRSVNDDVRAALDDDLNSTASADSHMHDARRSHQQRRTIDAERGRLQAALLAPVAGCWACWRDRPPNGCGQRGRRGDRRADRRPRARAQRPRHFADADRIRAELEPTGSSWKTGRAARPGGGVEDSAFTLILPLLAQWSLPLPQAGELTARPE